jgi:N-acyl-D-aspartate/D-glutamate deacylase
MSLVIRAARLIDGTGKAPLERAVVVIEGRRISAGCSAWPYGPAC